MFTDFKWLSLALLLDCHVLLLCFLKLIERRYINILMRIMRKYSYALLLCLFTNYSVVACQISLTDAMGSFFFISCCLLQGDISVLGFSYYGSIHREGITFQPH